MADSPGSMPRSADASAPDYAQQELRQRAFRRVLIAIALILAAIVVLNALNRLRNSQREEVLAPAPTTVSAPEAPSSSAPETAASAAEAPASVPSATPTPTIEQPASSAAATTPPAVVTAAPSATTNTAPHPAPPEVINHTGLPPANDLPGTPLAIAPQVAPVAPKAPQTKAPPVTPPAPIAAAPAAAPASPTPSAPVSHPAGLTVKSYTVQLGVFARYDNAQQLYQRLHDAGVPAQLESRVTLGPFRDRAEAAQAMAKMKQMGLAPVLVPNAVLTQ